MCKIIYLSFGSLVPPEYNSTFLVLFFILNIETIAYLVLEKKAVLNTYV